MYFDVQVERDADLQATLLWLVFCHDRKRKIIFLVGVVLPVLRLQGEIRIAVLLVRKGEHTSSVGLMLATSGVVVSVGVALLLY